MNSIGDAFPKIVLTFTADEKMSSSFQFIAKVTAWTIVNFPYKMMFICSDDVMNKLITLLFNFFVQ